MKEMDEYYQKLVGTPVPKLIQCYKCGWKGNKLKIVKFKRVDPKRFCPDCGSSKNFGGTTELVFWRTANGLTNPVNFEDLVKGKYN